MIKPNIIFAGLAQNCESHLPKIFENINKISQYAEKAAYIFIENDSKDATKNGLIEWGKGKINYNFINLDGLKQIPIRTLRLEFMRNAYLEIIKKSKRLSEYDILVIIDMDDANTFPLDSIQIDSALRFLMESPERAAVFANQAGKYYDIWALRHKDLCPSDAWEEVFDMVRQNNCSDEEAFREKFANRIPKFESNHEPIEVDSDFGGLGIYKISYIKKSRNPYLGSKMKFISDDPEIKICRWAQCEHVHFHEGIRNSGGKLYIYPGLINDGDGDYEFPSSAYRHFIF